MKNKPEPKRLHWDKRNLRSELQEHRVNALGRNSRLVHSNQKGRQNATRFCDYCATNGHTPSWCRRKIRDEVLKRLEYERTDEKEVTLTHDYNRKGGPSHGSEQWIRGQDFARRNQDYTNNRSMRDPSPASRNFWLRPNSAYGNNNPNNGRS